MGVDGRLITFLWFVEAEAVAPTVSGAVKLLQQEDHCLVDNSQHPQSINTCQSRNTGPHVKDILSKQHICLHVVKMVASPSKDSFLSCALERASCTLSVSDFQASVTGQLRTDRSGFRLYLHSFKHINNHMPSNYSCLVQHLLSTLYCSVLLKNKGLT